MRKLVNAGLTVIMYFGDADYNCNWIGGYAVYKRIAIPGTESAGFVDITTPDGIVHGQVKQTGKFSFVRIYESGHEVPFYQPVVALTMVERAEKGLDIATVKIKVGDGYMTKGPRDSTYREGNATVQTEVVPTDAVYNLTTNEPDLPPNKTKASKRRMRRGLSPARLPHSQ